MLSSIGSILIVSGLITAGGGLASLLFPRLFLRLGFGDASASGSSIFFAQHWGVIVFVVGALIVYSAYAPAIRVPVLVAAAVEKIALGPLVYFGPLKRTGGMTAIALGDGLFAILYIAYLAGL